MPVRDRRRAELVQDPILTFVMFLATVTVATIKPSRMNQPLESSEQLMVRLIRASASHQLLCWVLFPVLP